MNRSRVIPPNFHTVAASPTEARLLEKKYMIPAKAWGGQRNSFFKDHHK